MGYSRLSVARQLREPVAAAAHHLRESGLIRVAQAECNYCHDPGQPFSCHEPGLSCDEVEFGCGWEITFVCPWPEQFSCYQQFGCSAPFGGCSATTDQFRCPAYDGETELGFHCDETKGVFSCPAPRYSEDMPPQPGGI